MQANIRKTFPIGALLLSVMVTSCGKGAEPAAAPAVPKTAAPLISDSSKSKERPPEPTEAEIRELVAASIDQLNRQGGIKLTLSATGQPLPAIRVRFEDYEKVGCNPYTLAWRCEGKISLSYPGTELPAETLAHSRRFQKDAAGNWTMD